METGAISELNQTKAMDALKFMGAVRGLSSWADERNVGLNHVRQGIMLAQTKCAGSLSKTVQARCNQVIANRFDGIPDDFDDPLARLTLRILEYMETNKAIDVNSESYIPGILNPAVTYSEPQQRRKRWLQSELLTAVPDKVVRVLRAWFSIPDDYKVAAKAHFVHLMVETFGAGVLLLPHVWTVYDTMPFWLLNQGRMDRTSRQRFRASDMSAFRDAIVASPPANPESGLFAQMNQLKLAYVAMVEAWQNGVASLEHPSAAAAKKAAKRRRNILDPDYDAKAAMLEGPLPITLPRHIAIRTVLRLLRAGLAAATGPSGHNADPLVKKMVKESDVYQPLRELASSRSKINGRAGENLTKEIAQTPGGRFSLLLFRNVLFNTQYLTAPSNGDDNPRVIFTDLEDFTQHVDNIRTQQLSHLDDDAARKRWFCNKRAFGGQAIGARDISNATVLWEVASDPGRWSSLRPDGTPMTFADGLSTLQQLSTPQTPIPGFGALTSYLTLADMCSHGIVAMPSPIQMGEKIYQINKGALAGLKHLGYLGQDGKRKRTKGMAKTTVVAAFELFYNHITDALSAQEARDMGWNTLVAEHVLCKVVRLKTYL